MSAKLKLFRVFYTRDGRERSQTFALVPYSPMDTEVRAHLVARRANGVFLRVEPVVKNGQQLELYP